MGLQPLIRLYTCHSAEKTLLQQVSLPETGREGRRGQEETCSALPGRTLKKLTRKWIERNDWNVTVAEVENKYLVSYSLCSASGNRALQPLTSAVGLTLLPSLSRRFWDEDDVWESRIQHQAAPWHSLRVWVLLQAGNRLFRSVNTHLCSATFWAADDTRRPLMMVSWGLARLYAWRFEFTWILTAFLSVADSLLKPLQF